MKTEETKTTDRRHGPRMSRFLLSPFLTGCLLATLSTANAQLSFVEREATIRSNDANHDESKDTRVKYNTGDFARKSYYQFDIPSDANTNAGFDLTFTAARKHHLTVWGLDQPYPDFNADIIWSTAQANQPDPALNNDMLRTGPFTATPLYQTVSPSGSSFGPWTFHIPAPWGAHVFGSKLILVLTGRDGPGNDGGGFRVQPLSAQLGYDVIISGTPPSIGAISDLTTGPGKNSATVDFTLDDPEDGPDALFPLAVSSDEFVVPSANVVFGGSGADRTLQVIGGDTLGTAEITVTVWDASGNRAEQSFRVTVKPLDDPPLVSDIAPTNTLLNSAVDVPFTVEDGETAAAELTVTGFVQDYSTNILKSLLFNSDAGGTNRTVTVTPVTGASGVGVATINVGDTFGNTSSVSFAVMVLPSADTVFYDGFEYPLNSKILETSGGLWIRRNSSAQNVNLKMSSLAQEALIRPKNGADDGSALLVGAPYTPGDGAILYTKFKATWTDLGDIPVVGDSDGAFVQLAINPTATSGWQAGVGTVTNEVPAGVHRLKIGNTTDVMFPLTTTDLFLETPYNVVTRYDVDTGLATLWVNAADENDPSVTTDADPASTSYVNLRQDNDMGNVYVDDLTVVLVRKPMITRITPPSEGALDILFTAGGTDAPEDFAVVGSAVVTGPYDPVPAVVSSVGDGQFKATVSGVLGDENFYRVVRTSIVQF